MTYATWTTTEAGRHARVSAPYRAFGTLVCEAIVHVLAIAAVLAPLVLGIVALAGR